MKTFLGGVGAAIGAKVLTGFVVAAAAATVAVAATEVATTGSLNPSDWGQQVTQQVQTCKDTLRASGTRGIGQCVSQFAKQHGALVSGHASDARQNGNANGNDNGNGNANGNANGHNKDKSNDHGNSSGHGNSGNGTNGGAPRPKVTTEPPETQAS
jgi:hypothetical protein